MRLRPDRRELVEASSAAVLALAETLALFSASGPEDFFLHVAVRDSEALQRLVVDHLATRPEVGHARTHLILDRPLVAPVRPTAVEQRGARG